MKKTRPAYLEHEEGEVRRSGVATIVKAGYTDRVHSCRRCADVLDVPWQDVPFEGVCLGCEVTLSGLV